MCVCVCYDVMCDMILCLSIFFSSSFYFLHLTDFGNFFASLLFCFSFIS